MKKKFSIKILAIALIIIFTGCSKEQNNTEAAEHSSADTDSVINLSPSDTQSDWDTNTATKITLQGSSASVDGTGAAVKENIVTITKSGIYVISGTLDDGQIAIAATKDDEVRLILNGADITNLTGAPIYASQCDKLIVTLADRTINKVTDGAENYKYEDTTNEEPNAALFSKDDLTINGNGSLEVSAGFNNGIGTKDNLIITSGNLVITAANHGLRGNDSVSIQNGSFNITAGNDAIQTNENVDDTTKGWIVIENGVFEITSAHDGIQSATTLNISGGNFKITSGGGVEKMQTVQSSDETSDSYKGIKSTDDMTISAGTFTINSYDDSIHAGGNITISGGDFTLSSGDDGIHSDIDLAIAGGDINILNSYEGLEASIVNISDGVIRIVASDDGINAAGGTDGSSSDGRFGQDRFSSIGNYSINISGGDIGFFSSGDGVDSNGAINISGGHLVSIIDSSSDNEALDCDGELNITGGEIIYGGTNAGGNYSSTSTQSYVYINSEITEGNEISVKKDGNTLISYVPDATLRALAFSCTEIVGGEDYEVYADSELISTVTAGTGSGGMGGRGGGMRRGVQRPDGVQQPTDRQMPDGAQPPTDRQMPDGTQPPTDKTNVTR